MLEVSENGYFNWRKRGICQRKQDDKQLTVRIEDAFHDNRGVYWQSLAFMQNSKNKEFAVEESGSFG